MTEIECVRCSGRYDVARHPRCPACLVEVWLGTERFVREKHDPRRLPLSWPGYRSVLSPGFVADPRPHLEYAAHNGRWYRDTYYEMFVHLTESPLGLHPGAGIPEGKTEPEHTLDSLLIVEADSQREAHAFAVAREQFEAQVRAGEFSPLPACASEGCDLQCVPGLACCAVHADGATGD